MSDAELSTTRRDGLVEIAAASREPQVSTNAEFDPRLAREVIDRESIRSMMVIQWVDRSRDTKGET